MQQLISIELTDGDSICTLTYDNSKDDPIGVDDHETVWSVEFHQTVLDEWAILLERFSCDTVYLGGK